MDMIFRFLEIGNENNVASTIDCQGTPALFRMTSWQSHSSMAMKARASPTRHVARCRAECTPARTSVTCLSRRTPYAH